MRVTVGNVDKCLTKETEQRFPVALTEIIMLRPGCRESRRSPDAHV